MTKTAVKLDSFSLPEMTLNVKYLSYRKKNATADAGQVISLAHMNLTIKQFVSLQ